MVLTTENTRQCFFLRMMKRLGYTHILCTSFSILSEGNFSLCFGSNKPMIIIFVSASLKVNDQIHIYWAAKAESWIQNPIYVFIWQNISFCFLSMNILK